MISFTEMLHGDLTLDQCYFDLPECPFDEDSLMGGEITSSDHFYLETGYDALPLLPLPPVPLSRSNSPETTRKERKTE